MFAFWILNYFLGLCFHLSFGFSFAFFPGFDWWGVNFRRLLVVGTAWRLMIGAGLTLGVVLSFLFVLSLVGQKTGKKK